MKYIVLCALILITVRTVSAQHVKLSQAERDSIRNEMINQDSIEAVRVVMSGYIDEIHFTKEDFIDGNLRKKEEFQPDYFRGAGFELLWVKRGIWTEELHILVKNAELNTKTSTSFHEIKITDENSQKRILTTQLVSVKSEKKKIIVKAINQQFPIRETK